MNESNLFQCPSFFDAFSCSCHLLRLPNDYFCFLSLQGLRVFLNLQSVLHDESQWKFPHEFNPKNFLNDSGEFVKPDAFLPFSAGPRVCIGESLAQMLIFLFFTTLLQHFEIASPENNKLPDFTALFGLTQSPVPYKVSLKCRRC
ncbi:cytochrome P450 2K6-like [Protopterus annectens]|uniref:cytochrome P450 2K6-like n=1 Tax=Protopterus annectens TaxID=7888 RepID=UPI001CFA3F64|nr:cytochrome P450 2K6-like [Protopterus annectens]